MIPDQNTALQKSNKNFILYFVIGILVCLCLYWCTKTSLLTSLQTSLLTSLLTLVSSIVFASKNIQEAGTFRTESPTDSSLQYSTSNNNAVPALYKNINKSIDTDQFASSDAMTTVFQENTDTADTFANNQDGSSDFMTDEVQETCDTQLVIDQEIKSCELIRPADHHEQSTIDNDHIFTDQFASSEAMTTVFKDYSI